MNLFKKKQLKKLNPAERKVLVLTSKFKLWAFVSLLLLLTLTVVFSWPIQNIWFLVAIIIINVLPKIFRKPLVRYFQRAEKEDDDHDV